MCPFYSHWKVQKTFGFQFFSGSIKLEHLPEIREGIGRWLENFFNTACFVTRDGVWPVLDRWGSGSDRIVIRTCRSCHKLALRKRLQRFWCHCSFEIYFFNHISSEDCECSILLFPVLVLNFLNYYLLLNLAPDV